MAISSTPLHHPAVEMHRAMAGGGMGHSPLRRNSSFNKANLSGIMELPDDEVERDRRRQSLALQRRKSHGRPLGSTSSAEVSIAFDKREVQDHLTYCTKLFIENKITAKNAWQLKITQMLSQIGRGEEENILQVGASALEVGCKVYGVRVDDAHRRALQLAGELLSMDAKRKTQDVSDDGEDWDEEDGDGEDQPKAKKKRVVKKRTGKGPNPTIDEDDRHLFGDLRQLEPVCFSTVEDFEVGSFDNLFTVKQPLDPITNQLILFDGALFVKRKEDIKKVPSEILEIEVPNTEGAKLCSALHSFSVTEWDPEKIIDQQEVFYDDDGFPLAELDGSVADIFQPCDDVNNAANSDYHPDTFALEDDEERQQQRLRYQGDVAHVIDAITEHSRRQTEYGYNDLVKLGNGQVFDKLWAGPSHWKLKYIRPSGKLRYSGSVQHQEPQRRHHKRAAVLGPQEPVDLEEMLKDRTNFDMDPEESVAFAAKSPADYTKITLPTPNIDLIMFNRHAFEIKSKCSLLPKRVSQINSVDDNQSNGIAGDADGMSNASMGDNNDDGPMDDGEMPLDGDNNPTELVPEPLMVECDNIAFTTRTKHMDMYKLKKSVWSLLKGDIEDDSNVVKPIRFSEIYEELPKHLNAESRENLSVHLAFLGLLDLCNAKSLRLCHKKNNFVDFRIITGRK